MAGYFGNVLIERQTLEHQAAHFKLAVMQIRAAEQQHDIQAYLGQLWPGLPRVFDLAIR